MFKLVLKSRFSGEQYRDIAVPEETNGLSAIAVHRGESREFGDVTLPPAP